MFDLVIKGGNVLSFSPDRILEGANIGVTDGKIQSITKEDIRGKEEINAISKIVSPGFIDFHSHVNGRLYSAECLARQGATTTIGGERYFDAGIIKKIHTDGFLINQGFYISYSFTLRRAVGLHDPSARATRKQIDSMIGLAERFFQFGVMGIHLGLEYAPGTSEEELEDLLTLAKQYHKVAMVHLRKDGYEAMESLEEIIRVATKTGAAVNILHIMYTAGLRGLMDQFLHRIKQARAEGCDITADSGLYGAYPTYAGSLSLGEGWIKGYDKGVSEKNLVISSGIRVGQSCTKELFQYVRQEFPTTLITAFVFDEGQIVHAMEPDFVMLSTNAAYGPHMEGIGHPEGSGTFVKLIGTYVRDRDDISLLDAVKKITYMPARRIGLGSKGELKAGKDADITIFDLKAVKSNSNYVGVGDPNGKPEGIEYVIVNGSVILHRNTFLPKNRYSGKLVLSD